MNDTKNILKKCIAEYQDFEYYSIIIDEIEHNIHSKPDLSIESSKALIEGICKSILLNLKTSTTRKRVDKYDFSELFKETCSALSDHSEIEIDFIHRASSVVHYLGELRNKRGDISHGKAVPKVELSNVELAKFTATLTNGIVEYLLSIFLKIDVSYKAEILYDDNPDFNAYLDEEVYLDGVSYSLAMFDQDIIAYKEQLSVFKDSREDIEESE